MADKEEKAVPSSEDTGDKTYTQTEVDALRADDVEKRKDAERASSKHGERVKTLEASQGNWQSDIQTLRTEMQQNVQLLTGIALDSKSPDSELDPNEQGAYIKKAQEAIAKTAKDAEVKRQDTEDRRIGEQYQKEVEDLGLTTKDKTYREIYQYVRERNFQFADAVIAEVKTAKANEPKGSEEDKEKAIEEAARKMLEDSGQLKAPISTPSGSTGGLTIEEVKKMSPEEQAARASEIAEMPLSMG